MNTANKITLIRIIIPFIFLPALTTEIPFGKTIALALFVIASLSDWLDGYVARKFNMTSDFGSLLDPLADKILIAAALVCFVAIIPGIVRPWMVVVIISRDFLITGLRMLAAKRNTVMAAESLGKHKTAWQMSAIVSTLVYLSYGDFEKFFPRNLSDLIYEYIPGTLKIIYLCIVGLTLISGAIYLWRYRDLYRQHV